MKATSTFVTFLLDRSGSMERIRQDTIGGFNTYLNELKKQKGITFTFLQFDSMSIDVPIKHEPIAKVPELTVQTFQPRGSTPLIDACYKTIKGVEEYVGKGGYEKVVICFQTDGQENCSREHTWAELTDLIKEKTALGWQFNFMGASIDAYAQATMMGLSAGQTMSYDSHSEEKTRGSFVASAAATTRFASGRAATTAYTPQEKRASGDVFDPDLLKAKPAPAPAPAPKKAIVDDVQL